MKKILPVVLALSSIGFAALSSPAAAAPPQWNIHAHKGYLNNPMATTTTAPAPTSTSTSTDTATQTTTTTTTADTGSTPTTTDTTSSTSPTTTTSTTTQLDPRLTCNLPDFQQEIINRINQARAAGRTCGSTSYGPAPALGWNGYLFGAAAGHSFEMAANNYFSHTGLDGSDPGQRITSAGYAWSAYGENIAGGQTSVQTVVDGWLNSPGHCANIMNPNFTEIGAACVSSSTSQYSTYWTMDFARPY